ncbi:MAG: DUF2851 family protein [Chloroflexi bacterium]|nr:DUF2851 family protein [Chloroflexota bacterium]
MFVYTLPDAVLRHVVAEDFPTSEADLSRLWGQGAFTRRRLTTTHGQGLQVVYPGRRSRHGGPDFLDAVFTTARGETRRGDVEIHLRSRDWRQHGHHRDQKYNNVALHVVLWDEGRHPTLLERGGETWVLCLSHQWPAAAEDAYKRMPCRSGSPELLGHWLEEMGDERLREKAEGYQELATTVGEDQALYQGIMEALGYSQNRIPFARLAQGLPWADLVAIGEEGGLLALQAALLGSAGLLPHQRGNSTALDEWCPGLQAAWTDLGREAVVSVADWCFVGLRPRNLPSRRLAGASYLVHRHQGRGLAHMVADLFQSHWPKGLPRALEAALSVTAQGYWASHRDLGRPGPGDGTLIGPGRARDIVVNVVLPFFWCRGGVAGERAREIYRRYPRMEENQVTQDMAERLGLERGAVNSARRQQGLLYLHKTHCLSGHCPRCPRLSL